MAATIGIKIANGEFYSILEENSSVKKRLILTTVHNNQLSVQIDLYRSFALTMADAQYIGSLVVEKIKPKPKGEPSIELVISSNKKGDITADAIDLDTRAGGEHQILNVSLKSLDLNIKDFEIPDFELEQNDVPPSGLYARAQTVRQEESKRFPWIVLIIIGIVLILALGAAWFFFFGGKNLIFSGKEDKTSTEQIFTQTPEEPLIPEEPEPVSPPPVIQAPVIPPPTPVPQTERVRPPAPVSFYKVPATIPREGVPYTIRWGDTLWDISEAFYRTPWLYPRIARFNNIRNPDYIIAGRTIRVPPKN